MRPDQATEAPGLDGTGERQRIRPSSISNSALSVQTPRKSSAGQPRSSAACCSSQPPVVTHCDRISDTASTVPTAARSSLPSPTAATGVPPQQFEDQYMDPAGDDRRLPNQDTETAGRLYALHLHEICPGLPPVEVVVKRLQEFQKVGLSMEQPCSMTEEERCWIMDNLTSLNRVLMRVDMEIKEEEPRKLRIGPLGGVVCEYQDTNQVFDACIILHVLLKRHKCIMTLDLVYTTLASHYPQLLCDALACNRGLLNLAIAFWEDFSPETGRTLVYSLCKMPALESVCISQLPLNPSAAGRIGSLVARSKSIRKVSFLNNSMSPEAAKELIGGLCRNDNLEVIRISDNALGADGARLLGEFLETTSKLQELSLRRITSFDEHQLIFLAEGLKRNGSLQKLEIYYSLVTQFGIVRLAEVLKTNTTLKCLSLDLLNLRQPEIESIATLLELNTCLVEVVLSGNLIDDTAAIWLARALRLNKTLKKLDLENNDLTSQGIVALVDALVVNSVLEQLKLGYVVTRQEEGYEDVTGALKRAVAHDRVRLGYDLQGVLQLSETLRVNANRITTVHLDESVILKSPCLKSLFSALVAVPCLEVLCIESEFKMDFDAGRRFAQLLITTKTLKQVRMPMLEAHSWALTAVMRGMAQNQSVSHLDLHFDSSANCSIRALLSMIGSNRTLQHFGLLTTKLSAVKSIAHTLPVNHVLTSFMIWEECGFEDTIFEINEILRRNVAYLNRAVEFAMNPQKFGVQRLPAVAYEELCQTDAFQKHLARVAGPHAVAKAMRNARRYITANLFAITGVCKGPVRCRPHVGGAHQIDCLNISCWLHIFSYLRVMDIVV
ncbi:uncharacterized protein LOC144105032 isoform X1 [Amblyomma americanum]